LEKPDNSSSFPEQELKTRIRQLEALFKNSLDGIAFVDTTNRIIDINNRFTQLFGYELPEINEANIDDILARSKPGTADRNFSKRVLSGETITTEGTRYTKEGRPLEVIIQGIPIIENGTVYGAYAIYTNITEQKVAAEELKYLSLHDQLTDLYNRSYFENELSRLNNSREYPITIIVADLDCLKLFNDTVGHEQGDRLLKECAAVLRKSLRSADILARIGGDEFIIILPRTDAETGKKIVGRIKKSIESYNRHQPGDLPLSLSIGLATADDSRCDLKKIFKEADDLMYRDKLHKGLDARSRLIRSLITALGERDYIAQGHTRRVELLCLEMGKRAGLSEKQLLDLSLLAQIHDLGKVGIPDGVLFKKEQLNNKDWQLIQQHPKKGYRIAMSTSDLSGIADFILKHHEQWDGKGYPLGITGQEIPVQCRILAIADAFDAMTSDRPYHRAMPRESALKELRRCAGSQFDPDLVELFCSVVEEDILPV